MRMVQNMKPVIRAPYFEVGTKNYVYGDTLLEYAIAADQAAEKYGYTGLHFQVGDILALKEYSQKNGYSGREIYKKIQYSI